MEILHEETGSKGRYFTIVDGHEAEITYSRASPHLVIVDHTGVPDVPAPKTLMAILLDSGGAKAGKAVVTD